jgi:hypothetical protein
LWQEVRARKFLVEGNSFADPEVYRWRLGLLKGVFSCLAIWNDAKQLLANDDAGALRDWLLDLSRPTDIWGEAAVPSAVVWLIWLRKNNSTSRIDKELAALAHQVMIANQPHSKLPLAPPYFTFEEVCRSLMGTPNGTKRLQDEAVAGSAFTAEPLMHLVTRTNQKAVCKLLWNEFSRLSHRVSIPDAQWEYCVLKISAGVELTRIYPLTYEWKRLRTEALTVQQYEIPPELVKRPWLLAFWWHLAPYRYTSTTNRVLIEQVLGEWDT